MSIAVCLKWSDIRPDVDPLSGAVSTDPRTSSASPADEAALEWGLTCAVAFGEPVTAITAGPAGADAVLRLALAAGAASAIRVDLVPAAPSSVVASALAGALAADVGVVLCGAWSVDRGSGSVPAFLAARLDAAQALGLISLRLASGHIEAERRLDRGRRERLLINTRPAVLSVEGGSARLRRASLAGVLAARSAPIDVRPGPVVHVPSARTTPFRPRPRPLPAPSGASPRERILALTGALTERTPPQRLELSPADAADRILGQLQTWGYLP